MEWTDLSVHSIVARQKTKLKQIHTIMETFQQFLEANDSKNGSTYELKCQMAIVSELKRIFKKYSLVSRTEAWDALTSKKGMTKMRQLLKNPDMNISIFRSL